MTTEPFHIAVAFALVTMLVMLAIRPLYVLYFYLGLLFFFPNVGWGVAKSIQVFNLYGKGTGVLIVPLIYLYLWALFAVAVIIPQKNRVAIAVCNIRKYLWVFNVIFVAYVLIGIGQGIAFEKVLSGQGVISIFNMSLLVIALLRMVRTRKDLDQLADLLVGCALLRGLWGAVRFAFLGGDVANVYENVQHANIALTFFDINDSLIACLAAFYAAWMLTWNGKGLSKRRKLLYYLVVGVELFVIIFSYRRTAWGGLMLAGLAFMLLQPWRRRVITLAALGGIGVTILTGLTVARFAKLSSGHGASTMLLYDVRASTHEGRFAELYRAFETVMEHPLFGVGPWGGYGPRGEIEFMHSGFLHVWLKTGALGLVIFIAILCGYALFCLSRRRYIEPRHRGLYEAGFAGLLFMIPTLFMGTPIIEHRTMQLIGLVMALPYLVYSLHGRRTKTASQPASSHVPADAALARTEASPGLPGMARHRPLRA